MVKTYVYLTHDLVLTLLTEDAVCAVHFLVCTFHTFSKNCCSHALVLLTYKSEVYDCNLVAVIHEVTEFYRVLISVILLPLLQRLYKPLSAVLNISETCVYLRVR